MEVLLDWFYFGSRIAMQFWVGQMERRRNFLLNYKTALSSPSAPPCAQSCSAVLKRSIKATPTLPHPLRSQAPTPLHAPSAFESQCKAVSSLRKDVLIWWGLQDGDFSSFLFRGLGCGSGKGWIGKGYLREEKEPTTTNILLLESQGFWQGHRVSKSSFLGTSTPAACLVLLPLTSGSRLLSHLHSAWLHFNCSPGLSHSLQPSDLRNTNT